MGTRDRTMLKKIRQRGKYIVTELIGAVIYVGILYFVSTWLAGYSLLAAYFGNLALMILFFGLEELSIRALESKGLPKKLSEGKDREKLYRDIKAFENNISFKTMLYIVYVFILIFSQIIDTYPAFAGNDFSNFILSNNYSILLLIALDMLLGQISKERARMKNLSEKLKSSFTEEQDE
ncbi:hypothetical protein AGMMS49983_13490 [Clostridia bacterium]|nr:hypothetical protein AGMMS49983_13490 [Clostridia bacterium]